jgi:hypothetical protein
MKHLVESLPGGVDGECTRSALLCLPGTPGALAHDRAARSAEPERRGSRREHREVVK